MIVETLYDFLMLIPNLMVQGISAGAFDVNWGVFDLMPEQNNYVVFNELFSIAWIAGYILPIVGLIPVIQIYILFDGLRVMTAILVRLKSFIPTLGV
jgi:hypothetical protein